MKKNQRSGSGSAAKKLLGLLKGDIWKIAIVLVMLLFAILLSLYVNVVIGEAVDFMTGKGSVDMAGVRNCCMIIACCVVVSAVLNYVSKIILDKIAFKTVKTLRNSLFAKLQRVSVSYIDRHRPGDIIARLVNDIDQISDGLILSFAQLFSGIVTVLGTLVFMFMLDYKITLIVLFASPVTLLVANFIARSIHKYFTRQTAVNGDLSAVADEAISGISVLRSFSIEDVYRKKLAVKGEKLRKASNKAVFFSSTVFPTTRLINGIIYAAVGVVGAVTVINNGNLTGGLTIGLLSSFLAFASKFSMPFNEISGVLAEFQGALAGAERVFDVIEEENEPEREGSLTEFGSEGNVLIDNVSFSYDPNVPLIRDFSLDVKHGMRVAIVGPTGCGKTTFINLLMRFYDVDGGAIYMDGVDSRNITRDAIHRNYGMVLQETWLRSGTVRDNISIGKPDATDEEIVAAATLAHADPFIRKLEKGYDTVVSDDLAKLSYGQKQLICIARLMLSKPPMLILDEATSSIDTRTEIKVQLGFKKLMNGRTSFIVAHRLSTIKNCDVIVVMKNGRIIEQGTHDELIAHEGFYKELYDSQSN
ncbi:MAG: ABC transporter ATP-binding protein/permease [Clostridia bacterium]|nr:ABC transporter ATP-binding protein/permease [Clostridia bacterium]